MEGGQGIPNGSSRPHTCHIDTVYLLPLLLGRDDDENIEASARALVASAVGRPLGVSVFSVGEAFMLTASEPATHALADQSVPPSRKLRDLVATGKLEICWADRHNRRVDVFQLASEIRRRYQLAAADSFIVAASLACSTCSTHYTTDGKQIRNLPLADFCRRGGRDFTIKDAPVVPSRRR